MYRKFVGSNNSKQPSTRIVFNQALHPLILCGETSTFIEGYALFTDTDDKNIDLLMLCPI